MKNDSMTNVAKDVTNTKRLIEVLKKAKIPQKVLDELTARFSVTDMRNIVFAELKDDLMVIDGIGEKRAETIIRVLTGRIPEPLAMKKLTAEVREQLKAEIREKAKGFSCRTYEAIELWRHVWDRIQVLKEYRPKKDEDPEIIIRMRKLLKELKALIFVDKPLTVRFSEGRIVRLNKSAVSEVARIDYESKKPTEKLMVLQHDVNEVFAFNWNIFSNDKTEGQRLLDEFQKAVMKQVFWRGVAVIKNEKVQMTTICGSSAGHQKASKVLMGDSKIVKANEKFLWFGKTMQEFVESFTTTGAEMLKAWANLLRPWMKPFMTKDGQIIRVRDILVVKDVSKVYEILKGRKIGKDKKTGKMYEDGTFNEPVILGDGAMLAVYELAFQGQASSTLFKGFGADASSSIVELCLKHGISVEDFLNTMVEGIDGKMHRIGDFKMICGEGCWKGDKVFHNYAEYLEWLDQMAESYPGIDYLYLLRQAEEIEDEDKVRRLTASLIRQWMHMDAKEIRKLTKRARMNIQKDKTFKGALNKLAGLWKTEEERSECEKLFEDCPWLIMAPAIQEYLKEAWTRKVVEAASGKFRTEGQYPYIMQDPVALLEVWVLGMSPDDPTLGILKDGEVSVADVPDGRELLCVRFPANFLTAQVKVNRAFKKEFASLNGVMVLSVHDLILIAQDGDVDGDEMCVIYNKLAIKLTKRMIAEFEPPVILFNHGGKPERKAKGSKEAFVQDIAEALWRAKRYDSVGIYANMAMKCAYLAAICLKQGRKQWVDTYLLWMSAASTGAILAIDQVKGNDVDKELIHWLEDTIGKNVNKAMHRLAEINGVPKDIAYGMSNPYSQYYVCLAKRKPIPMDKCVPAQEDNFLDEATTLIERTAGEWEFKTNGAVWNAVAAEDALTDGKPRMRVPAGVITKEMVELLGDNWFKLRPKTEEEKMSDKTRETLKKMRPGTTVGLKDFLLLLWRNESSMAYTMEGRQLWEKKEEYYGVCRQLLQMLLENGHWESKNVKPEDRWSVLVNIMVRDALELGVNNNVDKKGSYAMFCLKLIAPELRKNAKENRVDMARFFGISMPMEDMIADIDLESIEDDMELFDATPEQTAQDEEPEFDMDDIPPEEDDCWPVDVSSLPDLSDFPEDCPDF